MRHMKSGRRLGRNSTHRKAMYRNMVTSLMIHGRIKTTEAKAKELRRIADRVITLGKKVPPSALTECEADSAEFKKLRAARIHNIRRARKLVLDALVGYKPADSREASATPPYPPATPSRPKNRTDGTPGPTRNSGP